MWKARAATRTQADCIECERGVRPGPAPAPETRPRSRLPNVSVTCWLGEKRRGRG
ncbi:hypothetical protein JYU34_016463 [Plutella xylostella]|uniref:Uncharacterized protein n=1 Tax=Plutella xylostella TaxID=51655 RepID=A0ABQ7Q2Q0_PLUXY|nr:hypothetical protein JYU34_016463 [Plutella xylostella]